MAFGRLGIPFIAQRQVLAELRWVEFLLVVWEYLRGSVYIHNTRDILRAKLVTKCGFSPSYSIPSIIFTHRFGVLKRGTCLVWIASCQRPLPGTSAFFRCCTWLKVCIGDLDDAILVFQINHCHSRALLDVLASVVPVILLQSIGFFQYKMDVCPCPISDLGYLTKCL